MSRRPSRTAIAALAAFAGSACAMGQGNGAERPAADPFLSLRLRMVASQIEARGVRDPAVLAALRKVPRQRFVPRELLHEAYADRPLPIGQQQTISQPYIVALMTELVGPQPAAKILEIGTGSGYQAAVLAECAGEVYSIEILPELGQRAAKLLSDLGYVNVHVRIGDGFDGWPEHAPFDGIVVTAAPTEIPQPLLDQLAPGGRLVIPLGEGFQNLVLVRRTADGFERRTVSPVRFVPMTGKARQEP